MKSVVVIGAGGLGRETLEIFREQKRKMEPWDILGFVDDNKELHGKVINGYPVLGDLQWLAAHSDSHLHCICAVGNCETKKQMVERLRAAGVRFCSVVHPSVIMSEFVELGEGVTICAGSVLTVNITIGNHVLVNLNASVGHDVAIGDYCTINPAVQISGNCHLAEGVYVGTSATLLQGVSVGSWAAVSAGAIVTKDIPERSVAAGVPAKVIRRKE